jgi:predicted ABC-type ATPase
MADAPPKIIILAGPNGAGKTTASRTFLAEALKLLTYVNADVIAQGLAGFDPGSTAIQAGRIMLARLDELAAQRASFAFESTLAGRSLAGRLDAWRQFGYGIHLTYFWLASPDLAVARVAQRVRMGGHGVPEPIVRQRYGRSLRNFFRLYRPRVSSWEILDGSSEDLPQLVAYGEGAGDEVVVNEAMWRDVKREAGA